MFGEKFQGRLISVFHNVGKNPLADWLVQCKGGDLCTVQDDQLKSNVLQIRSPNVVACSITTPVDPAGSLDVRLPFLTLQLKNLDRYFTFEVTLLDTQNIRRRVRASNYQTVTRTSVFATSVPLQLKDGWNQLQCNLADITQRSYGTSYARTVRLSVNANCRLRCVFFSDQLYTDDQLPESFRMYRTMRPRNKPTRAFVKASGKSVPAKTSSDKAVAEVTSDKAATEAPVAATKVVVAATELTVAAATEVTAEVNTEVTVEVNTEVTVVTAATEETSAVMDSIAEETAVDAVVAEAVVDAVAAEAAEEMAGTGAADD